MIIDKFVKEAYEKILKENSNETIALIGGSFKPPTAGHLYMVEKYLEKADKVIILISNPNSKDAERKTNNGNTITSKMSKKIWEIFLERYDLENKVEVIISPIPSPIKAIYAYVGKMKNVNIILGVSKKNDDLKRYVEIQRYFSNKDINVIDPIKTAIKPLEIDGKPISATMIRDNIDYPLKIRKYFPKYLTDNDFELIMEILNEDR